MNFTAETTEWKGWIKIPAQLLKTRASLWVCFLNVYAKNRSGYIKFNFKDLSEKLGVPEQTLRAWHQDAKKKGYFHFEEKIGRDRHCRIKSFSSILVILGIERRFITPIYIECGSLSFWRDNAKKFLHKAVAYNGQEKSILAIEAQAKQKKKSVDVRSWKKNSSSLILQGRSRIFLGPDVQTAGVSQEWIAKGIGVSRSTVSRNLKSTPKLRIFQMLSHHSEENRSVKIPILNRKRSLLFYGFRPNYYDEIYTKGVEFHSFGLPRGWRSSKA